VRLELILWIGVTVHFAWIGVLYAFIGDDPAGAALLIIAAGLGGLTNPGPKTSATPTPGTRRAWSACTRPPASGRSPSPPG
jgi:hypothetical protein